MRETPSALAARLPPKKPSPGHLRADLDTWRQQFFRALPDARCLETLFDRAPDIVFSIKDRAGRYVSISESCTERCGLASRHDAIGKTAHEIFPPHMAVRYQAQDLRLFDTGEPVVDNLDLTLFNDRSPGWCLTNKEPLRDSGGAIIGLVCMSRDLHEPSRAGFIDARFVEAVDHILTHYPAPLRIESLARRAGVSVAQFERRMKRIFQLSAGQFITKTRIDIAINWLKGSDIAIADIALRCGFCDQSALSRQFRALTGLSPRQYRQLLRRGN
ncbi:HTH-type transcriptional activator Btr [compost metagenome]